MPSRRAAAKGGSLYQVASRLVATWYKEHKAKGQGKGREKQGVNSGHGFSPMVTIAQ